ncbi:MAG: hypothetical protein WAN86_21270 [Hyphomicrobiaceae bacterium]
MSDPEGLTPLKCRGPEYLRIIYGPEYDAPEHLVRLRSRGLGRKRSLAMRELRFGQEALNRFIARTAGSRARGCVCRAGAGERAGGPAPVGGRLQGDASRAGGPES